MQNFVQVMFGAIIRTDKTYVGYKYGNFIISDGIFQALFVSDRLYVKFQSLLASVGLSQVRSPYSAQLSCFSFVIIRFS